MKNKFEVREEFQKVLNERFLNKKFKVVCLFDENSFVRDGDIVRVTIVSATHEGYYLCVVNQNGTFDTLNEETILQEVK